NRWDVDAQACCSNSVRYIGASAAAFALNAACAAASISGGGVVRVETGTPSSMKNSSWPAGEQMQSILAGRMDELWNWWGAFAGTWIVSPARTTCRAPR